jgi:hypothetical protein
VLGVLVSGGVNIARTLVSAKTSAGDNVPALAYNLRRVIAILGATALMKAMRT